MESIVELGIILDNMDIPRDRRDISRKENLRWIRRNLATHNGSHPKLGRALEMIEYFLAVRGQNVGGEDE